MPVPEATPPKESNAIGENTQGPTDMGKPPNNTEVILSFMLAVVNARLPALPMDPRINPAQRSPVLAPMRADADVVARRRVLVASLRARADADQALLRDWLDRHGIAHRDSWIANVIEARLDAGQLAELSQRGDVARIASNRKIRQAPLPTQSVVKRNDATLGAQSISWGVSKINAPEAWTHGVLGQGAVVAGEDTGYQWDHPALKSRYRGWNGSSADHNYNGHDAIHAGGSSCGADSAFPCDDHGHGTHTMGTMIGDDGGANQIGVAPLAKWIGCRNMNAGWGSPARYIECMEWMLAPTDLAGDNPDPGKALDVINNSWACVEDEGYTTGEEVRTAVDNVIAGGIFFAAAAGNEGSSCLSIINAPGTYAESFAVAATDSGDALANFSSRGPSPGATSSVYLDLSAPGVGVRSSTPIDSYGSMSGTSMATPHVAGTVALMISVNPALRGHPDQIAQILRATAVTQGLTDPWNGGCGGLSMTNWPNYQAGYGRLDAWTPGLRCAWPIPSLPMASNPEGCRVARLIGVGKG